VHLTELLKIFVFYLQGDFQYREFLATYDESNDIQSTDIAEIESKNNISKFYLTASYF